MKPNNKKLLILIDRHSKYPYDSGIVIISGLIKRSERSQMLFNMRGKAYHIPPLSAPVHPPLIQGLFAQIREASSYFRQILCVFYGKSSNNTIRQALPHHCQRIPKRISSSVHLSFRRKRSYVYGNL